MKPIVTQRAASVARQTVDTSRAERIAAAAVIAFVLSLFLLVRADPPAAPSRPGFVIHDLREMVPSSHGESRTGYLTETTSLADALQVLGAAPDEARAAARIARSVVPGNAAQLGPGTPFTAYFDTRGTTRQLAGFSMKISPAASVTVSRHMNGAFHGALLQARTSVQLHRIAGVIGSDLVSSFQKAGASREQAEAFANLFPEDKQLARGGRAGERFDAVVELIADERGRVLGHGELVFAAFNGMETSGSWYRFTPPDTGVPEFFNRYGLAGDEFLSRDPLRGGVLSSPFGFRVHPITGENVLHAGIDLRAPIGTPVRAAGSGLVSDMGFGEGYGWFIRLRHERGFETVYAHLSAFEATLTPGQTVMRGDVIGYVGDTGSTTGPHLHYEVLRHGRYVNPLTLSLPSGRDLSATPEIMAEFQTHRAQIDALRGASGSQAVAVAP